MGDNGAVLAGFTKELMAETFDYTLHILVQPHSDLGGRFKAWDCDECEWLTINGWNFTFEEIEPQPA